MDDIENKISDILSDPDSMKKLMSIAQALSSSSPQAGGEEDPPSHDPPPESPDLGFDPAMIGKLASIMQGAAPRSDDKKSALLGALKPYLSDERQKKVDRAMNMMRMTKLAKTAFSEFSGGED